MKVIVELSGADVLSVEVTEGYIEGAPQVEVRQFHRDYQDAEHGIKFKRDGSSYEVVYPFPKEEA